jgi:hypothetical protein
VQPCSGELNRVFDEFNHVGEFNHVLWELITCLVSLITRLVSLITCKVSLSRVR